MNDKNSFLLTGLKLTNDGIQVDFYEDGVNKNVLISLDDLIRNKPSKHISEIADLKIDYDPNPSINSVIKSHVSIEYSDGKKEIYDKEIPVSEYIKFISNYGKK